MTRSGSYVLRLALVLLLLLPVACNPWKDHTALSDPDLGKDVMAVIREQSNLSTFARLLAEYGYAERLSDLSACTVFAPHNEAWSGLNTKDSLLMDGILGSMIIGLKFRAADSLYTGKILSLNGKSMEFDAANQRFETAQILEADILAANAYIHIVDQAISRKNNIWEALQAFPSYRQAAFLLAHDTQVMDYEKSVQAGIDDNGQIIYNPAVYKDYNAFLEEYPLNDEEQLFTYILVEDVGYEKMKQKYSPYFEQKNEALVFEVNDSLLQYELCGDYVLPTLLRGDDLRAVLVNGRNVELSFDQQFLLDSIDCSNGMIYILSECNIPLRSKIKTVRIEGEDYTRHKVLTQSSLIKRYKTWASGNHDIMLAGKSLFEYFVTPVFTGSSSSASNLFNGTNFWLEYKLPVYSGEYAIYYVAHDDYGGHDGLLLEQKLFVSMPNEPALKQKEGAYPNAIDNHYSSDTTCFVGQSWAASPNPERVRLYQWSHQGGDTQYLKDKLVGSGTDRLRVSQVGELTLWLCNTTRYSAENAGFMFIDYIELVPIITGDN